MSICCERGKNEIPWTNGGPNRGDKTIEEETEGKVTAVELLFPQQFAKEENI